MRRSLGDTTHPKLPITPTLLRHIRSTLVFTNPLDANVWAICLLLFFGLLRKASVLPQSASLSYSVCVLHRRDVIFFKWGVMVTIRSTKTIQYRERALRIPLPRQPGHPLCPVTALVRALSSTPAPPPGSLAFLLPGHPLFVCFLWFNAVPASIEAM